MHDWRDLFPVKWIAAALVILVLGAAATYGVRTVTAADPPPASEVVANVQGIPPSGNNPCWWAQYAQRISSNPAVSEAYRTEVANEAGDEIGEAAENASNEVQAESLSIISDFMKSDFESEQLGPNTNLESVLGQKIAEEAPEIGIVDVIGVLDC